MIENNKDKKISNLIKIYITEYIKEEVIIDSTSYISLNEFINDLIIHLNTKNIEITKNKLKGYILPIFCQVFNLENYSSKFYSGKRVYFGFKLKSKESKTYITLENLVNKINELEVKINLLELKINKLINVTKESIKEETIDISDLNQDICLFINNFIDYDPNISKILYVQTIIEDFKKNTDVNISHDKFSKEFKKIIELKYPNIEDKRHNNKRYYKGLYYRNDV